MISYLSGTIKAKLEKTVVVDVRGVGYLVYAARTLLEKLQPGSEAEFYIHTHVREDDISLFGFSSNDEWHFFRQLISVSGVGPKSALEILNADVDHVKNAILTKNVSVLTKIQGVGKKTAERIIIDLEGKVHPSENAPAPMTADNDQEEIIDALISLGYTRQHVIQGLKRIPNEVTGEEAIIKYFLQNR